MFGLNLFSIFSRSNAESQIQNDIMQKPEKTQPDEPVWVFIWRMSPNKGVGHTAIQVGGESPKFTDTDKGRYMGLWPKYLPSVGPFKVIPLQSASPTNLNQDAESEQLAFRPGHFSHIAKEVDYISQPDYVYKVNGLDTGKIKQEMDRVQKNVETGDVRYQLFPNIKLFDWVYSVKPNVTAVMMENPFSLQPNKDLVDEIPKTDHKKIEAYNCSSLTKHFLEFGGSQFTPSKLAYPWGITPNGLATELEKMNAEKVTFSENDLKRLQK